MRHHETGIVFESVDELAIQLMEWFENFPSSHNYKWKQRLRDNLRPYQDLRWHESWSKTALPVFKSRLPISEENFTTSDSKGKTPGNLVVIEDKKKK